MSNFTDPAPEGDKFSEKEANGHYVLIYVVEYVDTITTKFGERDAIKINVADLTTNESYIGALWFAGSIVGSLKKSVGNLVLGQVVQGTPKNGQNPPWLLATVTDESVRTAANKWLDQNPGVLEGTPRVIVNAAPSGISGALA